MNPTKIGSDGLALIQHFEGCKLTAYPDPGTGGAPWTIGWGHTGPDVVPGLVITKAEADALLMKNLAYFERAVGRLVKAPLSQNQFDALVSFAYNVGAGNLELSTLRRLVNARDYQGAAAQFGRWVNAGGKPMKGLIRRRAAERALFEGRDWRMAAEEAK